MVVCAAGGGFDQAALLLRLAQAPAATRPDALPASRWTLAAVRVAIPELADYSLSGVWRVLQRCGLRWRSGVVARWSPDPDFVAKLAVVVRCLHEAAVQPERIVTLCLDEMGLTRWPTPAKTWGAAAPAPVPRATTGNSTNRPWRIGGALNVITGQVDYLDDYIVGRKQLCAFYRQLDAAYPQAARIYVIQDNWSIHDHADVRAMLARLPRIQRIFLPTYASWLNPIEKLWRWLRQEVLHLHPLAADWPALRARVQAFLEQFGSGSVALLRYVGLLGDGQLAQVLRHV